MSDLKKIISLRQASKISGYHQDYLSSLIRKNEIKGTKMGNNWFTTEEEIQNYIFKQQIRNKNWLVKSFLYFKKMNKSFLYSLIILILLSLGIYFFNKKYEETQAEVPNIKAPASVDHIGTTEKLNF
jgi:hypothetical protein